MTYAIPILVFAGVCFLLRGVARAVRHTTRPSIALSDVFLGLSLIVIALFVFRADNPAPAIFVWLLLVGAAVALGPRREPGATAPPSSGDDT
jgi:hypothetical protein